MLALIVFGIVGCNHQQVIEPYFCDPLIAYLEDGKVDINNVRVSEKCLRGVSARIRACSEATK